MLIQSAIDAIVTCGGKKLRSAIGIHIAQENLGTRSPWVEKDIRRLDALLFAAGFFSEDWLTEEEKINVLAAIELHPYPCEEPSLQLRTALSTLKGPTVTAFSSVSNSFTIDLNSTIQEGSSPIVAIAWSTEQKPSGSTSTIANPLVEDTTATVSTAGSYAYRITVFDANGLSATALIIIHVQLSILDVIYFGISGSKSFPISGGEVTSGKETVADASEDILLDWEGLSSVYAYPWILIPEGSALNLKTLYQKLELGLDGNIVDVWGAPSTVVVEGKNYKGYIGNWKTKMTGLYIFKY